MSRATGAPPRVAVLFPGAVRDPKTWSGSPYGLWRGLAEAGAEAPDINSEPPRALRFPAGRLARVRHRSSLQAAQVGAELAHARTLVAAARLVAARPLDGVVQVGAHSELLGRLPTVTYEDATVRQTFAMGEPFVTQATPHGLDAWIARQRRAYARAVGCCVGSRWAAGSIVEEYGVPAAKVHVVGFGRNRDPRPVDRDWRTPRFLFVGADWERKNGRVVVEAFARLRDEVPAATLDVAGGHPRLDVPGVTAHGRLSPSDPDDRARLEALFERATCFVMPSRWEAYGIVHLEAGAAGVPSIGTTVGGAVDAIGDGGVVVDPGDPGALLAQMRRLADPAVAAGAGARALARAPETTWRAVAGRILGVLGLPAH